MATGTIWVNIISSYFSLEPLILFTNAHTRTKWPALIKTSYRNGLWRTPRNKNEGQYKHPAVRWGLSEFVYPANEKWWRLLTTLCEVKTLLCQCVDTCPSSAHTSHGRDTPHPCFWGGRLQTVYFIFCCICFISSTQTMWLFYKETYILLPNLIHMAISS